MKQNIEKLESSVYTLVQKFETLVSENRRLKETAASKKPSPNLNGRTSGKNSNTKPPSTNSAKPCSSKSANSKKTCKTRLTA